MAAIATLRDRNAAFWARAAPGWIANADRHDQWAHPMGAAALDRLRPRPGERILDIGCGCGGTTADLAAAVRPGGTAVGLDLAAAMVDAARTRFPEAEFRHADLETAAPPGPPFDAAYSRMALMLLADPTAGCTAIRRALRPGGRLAATVFRDAAASPWLHATLLGAAPHLGPLPPLPLGAEPGPFAFADPARVTRILAAAGFTAITVESHDATMDVPDDPDAVADWLITLGPAGAAYRTAPPPQRDAARAEAARLLDRYRTPGTGFRLPTGIWLVSAERPA
ncbi:class I SAM-dependent methyltransferase [Jidongwangia harbinensis]|uniref:class I SAM-dependent methyltransferase n=1 Tax=Jidongwangia harbinensis TaxID=2878561 RepID=UPI002106D2D0|nr:methyltransferase domain-containing protein [Jidongwangia harbinensis]